MAPQNGAPGLFAVRLAQAVLGATACVLLALATRRFFGAVVGVVAGVALATYAPAIFFDGLLQKSALDTVCLTWSLWLMGGLLAPDAVVDPVLRRRWLVLGIALGALSLTRENALEIGRAHV